MGTKSDIVDANVNHSQKLKDIANLNSFPYLECSAYTCDGLAEIIKHSIDITVILIPPLF